MSVNLRHMLGDLAKKIALAGGATVDKAVPVEMLAQFFLRVRPVTTNHPLIRIGPADDAGYLIPDVLAGIKTCFSPGVSDCSDFENELAKLGIRSFLADYSVDGPPLNNPLFSFKKKFLGSQDKGNYITLSSWVNECAGDSENDMILQMDIEESEYDVIIETPASLFGRFRVMLIEFHSLERLLDTFGFRMISACFDKLLQHFSIVHIHPNNCQKTVKYGGFEIPPVMELTFLRKDMIETSEYTKYFPHPLDRKNVQGLDDIVLPQCWYK